MEAAIRGFSERAAAARAAVAAIQTDLATELSAYLPADPPRVVVDVDAEGLIVGITVADSVDSPTPAAVRDAIVLAVSTSRAAAPVSRATPPIDRVRALRDLVGRLSFDESAAGPSPADSIRVSNDLDTITVVAFGGDVVALEMEISAAAGSTAAVGAEVVALVQQAQRRSDLLGRFSRKDDDGRG